MQRRNLGLREISLFVGVVSGATCLPTQKPVCVEGDRTGQVGDAIFNAERCEECVCEVDGVWKCRSVGCADSGIEVPDGAQGDAHRGESGPLEAGQVDASSTDRQNEDSAVLCVDGDGDGYYSCIDPAFPERPEQVDCDDSRFSVQPNGAEFPANDIDDNCNEQIDEVTTCDCVLTSASHEPSAEDLAASIELCSDGVEASVVAGESSQFAVLANYHGAIAPQRGGCLAMISTGRTDATYVESSEPVYPEACNLNLIEPSGAFVDPNPHATGESLVCDLAMLRLTLTPPRNARGIQFRFMFVTSEWPEWLCDSFNDTFYALYQSRAVQNSQRTNISFDRYQNEITVNVGWFENPVEWTVPLDDTPYGEGQISNCPGNSVVEECTFPSYCSDGSDLDYVGSGSGWLTTRAPIDEHDESITLMFSVHDEGDDVLDSAVFIDDFQWLPTKPSVGTTK